MEVHEYTTKYIDENRQTYTLMNTLKRLAEFVFAVLLIALTVAMVVEMSLDNIAVMACCMMAVGVAIILLMHSGSRIVHIILKKAEDTKEMQAVVYDDHIEFISKNIYGDKRTSTIKYENIEAVVYDSKSHELIITNTENEVVFKVTLAGKRKEARKFAANVFSTTPISIEIA